MKFFRYLVGCSFVLVAVVCGFFCVFNTSENLVYADELINIYCNDTVVNNGETVLAINKTYDALTTSFSARIEATDINVCNILIYKVINGENSFMHEVQNSQSTMLNFTECAESGVFYIKFNITISETVYEKSFFATVKINKQIVAIPDLNIENNFVYDSLLHKPQIPNGELYDVFAASYKEPGNYQAILKLKNIDNFEWDNGSSLDIDFLWSIDKISVEKPIIEGTYVYTGLPQTANIKQSTVYTIRNNVATEAGLHNIYIALVDSAHYKWEDGTTEQIKLVWEIGAFKVTKPEIKIFNLIFNSQTQHINIEPSEFYNIIGNSGLNVGKYNFIITLADKFNTVWEDGTTDDILESFNILPLLITLPTFTNSFVYNGNLQSADVQSTDYYDAIVTSEINVGTYYVTLALKDKHNTRWQNGETINVQQEWKIIKKKISKPIITGEYVYNGEVQIVEIEKNNAYTILSTNVQTAGNYFIIVRLNDVYNCEWQDGSTDNLQLKLTVEKAVVTRPEAGLFNEYTGYDQLAPIPTSNLYNISGNKAKDAGVYTATVSLSDSYNYKWDNNTAGDFVILWQILVAQIDDTNIKFLPYLNDSGNMVSGVSGLLEGDIIRYSLTENGEYLYVIPKTLEKEVTVFYEIQRENYAPLRGSFVFQLNEEFNWGYLIAFLSILAVILICTLVFLLIWLNRKVTIAFFVEGEIIASVTQRMFTKVKQPNPGKTKIDFNCWCYDSKLTKRFSGRMPMKNRTLYAKFNNFDWQKLVKSRINTSQK